MAFRYLRRAIAAAALWAAAARGQEIRFTQAASGIPAPTDIQNAGDGSGRLFFVQQDGLIRILRNGALLPQPFLDIRSKTRGDGEQGLLGLAFPPGFASSGRFYVNYTNRAGDTVIAQYRVTPNADVADAQSELVLLTIDQPYSNHNGGQLRFGPDGCLYIGMGDGGAADDPHGHGQNRASLLGKMLRVDVESEPGRVRVPPDNPFVNTAGARGEIWATGLRNPWRFSFDRATGDLWIADVGQDNWEEVNFQPASSRGGENYGWNVMEGTHCFRGPCEPRGLILPVAEYEHGSGCSVTGGFVYRGRAAPGLRGTYLYGDFCSGLIWGVERQGPGWTNRRLADSRFNITTFGEDEAGELYVANAGNGTIHRIEGRPEPRFSAAGVVNAASFEPGLVPGSLATVFASGVLDEPGVVTAVRAPLPTGLNGITVTVGGVPAPVAGLANRGGLELVNFQVPFEMSGRASAAVVVARGGAASAAVTVPVFEVQPAVFTSDGRQAIVARPDYTLVTPERPLERGAFAFLYATGLGRVANQPATGEAAPVTPLAAAQAEVRVTVAGLPCDVQYAGLAPGLAGVYQVNFRLHPGAPAGAADLVAGVGLQSSPAVRVLVE